MGAGVIPFAIHQGELLFLFQKVFSGRKAGYLIDFGGGIGEHEDYRATAVREFVEETETLYLADDPASACRSPERVAAQLPLVDALFQRTLVAHPHWWCRRAPGDGARPKDWRSYFIEFPFRELSAFNQAWEEDHGRRFKKRRELVWVEAQRLLTIYAHSPDDLWKRVRQLQDADTLIREISASLA